MQEPVHLRFLITYAIQENHLLSVVTEER